MCLSDITQNRFTMITNDNKKYYGLGIHYSLIVSFIILHFGCTDNSLTEPEIAHYQTIAYSSLSENEKASLTVDMSEAIVKVGKYKVTNGNHSIKIEEDQIYFFFLRDNSLKLKTDQRLIAVAFNTRDDPLLGPIIVIIDPHTQIAIGGVGRL